MIRVALLMVLMGCGPPPAENDGAGGAETCVWCADEAPYIRSCATTMIASGGQRVCVDDGEGRLCEAPKACNSPTPPGPRKPALRIDNSKQD